jgi:hypothetical protein
MRNSSVDSSAWEFKQEQFDPTIIDDVRSFKFEELSDPYLKEKWNQVAKRFSKMKLTPDIV